MPSYIAIDLKSFYASVECVERHLNPLTTNLLVADESRTDKTICLAVSPSLKAYGISGRARLFEAKSRILEVNHQRCMQSPNRALNGASYYDAELKQHPDWAVSFIVAPPRMALYKQYSERICKIYLKYIAPEDLHVYSIDEVFIDATPYLAMYKMNARELAETIINDIFNTTNITATAGIGTNLYLCKVAMDIVAKHAPADKNGVRIAELDEMSYRKQLWDHKPLTSFWRVGSGIARKLEALGIDTMGKIARLSEQNEDMLYRMFGISAQFLINHAWGWEPCTMEAIKSYRPQTHSISNGQVLTCAYEVAKARFVVREMVDALSLDLVRNHLLTNKIVLYIGFDRESLNRSDIREQYCGSISKDHYGRMVPTHVHGTANLGGYTSSTQVIADAVMALYDRIVNPILLVRRLNITAALVVNEKNYQESKKPVQLDLFTDYEAQMQQFEHEKEVLAKERRMQETLLNIKNRYGKNAILKGLNFADGATAKERNEQIGGHKA